ncbi:hypothetical protein SERLA73DRAFT_66060, partial [Serpula lacrymans var. lacrymans S7.3]
NGWTYGELCLDWMIHDFNPETREKVRERTQVFLIDGHSSYFTPELLEYVINNNICILSYPPHYTHVLQGLDVVWFAIIKAEFGDKVTQFQTLHWKKVSKADFTGTFGQAFCKLLHLIWSRQHSG